MSGCNGCAFKGRSTAVEDAFVGVRFRDETNITLCSTAGRIYACGEKVVVELDSGPALGHVEQSPMPVFKPCQKSSARRILRAADADDFVAHDQQLQGEMAGKLFAQERARALGLDMKISLVEFSLSGKKATFYFTSEGRVDFRQLVRDLSSRFSVRVKMVQVGARDEAGLVGGIGICGRTLCCSTWLKEFRPISIQMAKRQNLSLNPSKISGQCGRLLCCLAYEDDQYKTAKNQGGGGGRDSRETSAPGAEGSASDGFAGAAGSDAPAGPENFESLEGSNAESTFSERSDRSDRSNRSGSPHGAARAN